MIGEEVKPWKLTRVGRRRVRTTGTTVIASRPGMGTVLAGSALGMSPREWWAGLSQGGVTFIDMSGKQIAGWSTREKEGWSAHFHNILRPTKVHRSLQCEADPMGTIIYLLANASPHSLHLYGLCF